MGFTGLSRLLVTYIQLSMAILPVFVLITTVRSVAGDREAGVFEYLLSLPVGLAAWFWGKLLGRFVVVFLPVFLAMLARRDLGRCARCRGTLGPVRLLQRAVDGAGLVLSRHRHADLDPGALRRRRPGRRPSSSG